jgi:hypothetical protein
LASLVPGLFLAAKGGAIIVQAGERVQGANTAPVPGRPSPVKKVVHVYAWVNDLIVARKGFCSPIIALIAGAITTISDS